MTNFYQPLFSLLPGFNLIPHTIILLPLGSHSSSAVVWLSNPPMCLHSTLRLPHYSIQQSICLRVCLDPPQVDYNLPESRKAVSYSLLCLWNLGQCLATSTFSTETVSMVPPLPSTVLPASPQTKASYNLLYASQYDFLRGYLESSY